MPPELRLFGGVAVLADERPVVGAAAQPRRIAVLAVLAEACPAPVTRERLVGLLWPEQDEASARRLLTQAIYELRRELGDVITPGSGRDLSIDASAIDVDLVQFRRAINEGDADRAVALYRGPFLDGFHLRDGGQFERWAAIVRDTSERDLRRVIESAVARHEAAGDFKTAARWADQLVHATPHDAASVIRAMSLFERAGDPGSATRIATAYEQRMREDLDLPPDESVLRRAARIGERAPKLMVDTPLSSAAIPPVASRRAATPSRPQRKMVFAASLIVASLIGVTLVAVDRVRTATATRSPVVAIHAFDAHGGAEASHVAASLTPLLVANLDDAGGSRVEVANDDASGSRSLTGTVVVTGRSIRIDATLAPRVHGSEAYRATVTGSLDSVVVLAERLSMDLLPELYANLDPKQRREVVRGLRGVPAARAYLDGESALERAAFDSAYSALRLATLVDSGNALLWYRRAVAAEEVHHIDDADRSAAFADDRRGSLSMREQSLVHAYRVWRSGDIRGADSLYREILRTRPMDAEAWFHFAEVSYHGGPLIGRPLDQARDAWRRSVALDTNSFPALMHAIRLEARARNDSSLRVLLDRAQRMNAREPYLSEALSIAAAAHDSRTLSDADLRRLDSMPDASLQFVHAIVASFVERPDLARESATRLIDPTRPDVMRAEGFAALAHVAMSRGQTRLAHAMIDSLAQHSALKASWVRGYFATLPFLAPDSALASEAVRQLARSTASAPDAPLYLDLSVDASVADMIHRYTAALLAVRAGDSFERTLGCGALAAGVTRDLCTDLQHGIAAERLVRQSRPDDALRELEMMSMRVPYQLAGRSVYFARTRERYLRAQLLERVGRLDEAYDWYGSVPYAARLDYVYLAPSHLGRARIRDRQGDRAGAAAHYRRALELLSSSDDGARGLRAESVSGVDRTTP